MIAQNWLAHRVRRYHSNPHLAGVGQTNADHAHGVVSIIALLHPKPSAHLLTAALWHDAGERWAGDLPQPFKAEFPDIAKQHRWAEERLKMRAVPPDHDLTPEEELWLKLADRLEAVLFVAFHRPAQLAQEDWRDFANAMLQQARELGVADQVWSAIEKMEIEGWK